MRLWRKGVMFMMQDKKLVISDELSKYLEASQYIDWKNNAILDKANEFKSVATDEIHLIKIIYEYVRDEIKHSWDIKDKRVTCKASEVLEQKVGICWAKSNLLAALLRACSIPSGICYQRLTLGDTPEKGFCIHALNAVYVKSIDKWIRLDSRGNKEGVNAQMNLEHEQLAFPVRPEIGEIDYGIVYAEPASKLMNILENSDDAVYMYLHSLPDSI